MINCLWRNSQCLCLSHAVAVLQISLLLASLLLFSSSVLFANLAHKFGIAASISLRYLMLLLATMRLHNTFANPRGLCTGVFPSAPGLEAAWKQQTRSRCQSVDRQVEVEDAVWLPGGGC